MSHFLETAFSPHELDFLNQALENWRRMRGLPKESPDLEIAAAVVMNAYREGNRTLVQLQAALVKHKGLMELTSISLGSDLDLHHQLIS